MVFGPPTHLAQLSSYGGSAVLKAEELYSEHGPNRAALQSIMFRLWTGASPYEVATDPAGQLPAHGIPGFEPHHEHHKRNTTLFEQEDLVPWTVFTLVFTVLIVFDNFVLHRKAERLTLLQSLLYTTFWIAVAGMFCVYVHATRGVEDAFSWGTGYLLEWMLSVDNLFVFHRIFKVFKTPDEQKHKPLFYGIIGAIVFRMIFFVFEQILMHHVTWMHLVFGIFLIYTGIKAVSMDEDDDEEDEMSANNPKQGCMYQFLVKYINYVDRYDEQGRFFIPVEALTPRTPVRSPISKEKAMEFKSDEENLKGENTEVVVQYRATRLVLVVVCLEVTDLIFAVDSVSAIVAQIPDLFLAYTACVFAMLGLRAMFFAIDELVSMFSLLSYGVAFILIFLGCKLILRSWIHFPPKVVCVILLGTLFFSVFASLVADRFCGKEEDNPEDTESQSARIG